MAGSREFNQGFKVQRWPDSVQDTPKKVHPVLSTDVRFERIGQRVEFLKCWIRIGEKILCNACNVVVKNHLCKCNQPAEKPVAETVKIGDTLFVDGTPHVECGCCHQPVKLHSGDVLHVGKRDGVNKVFKEYKVPILVGWQEDPATIEYEDGFPMLKRHVRPALRTERACFDCWYKWKQSGDGWVEL